MSDPPLLLLCEISLDLIAEMIEKGFAQLQEGRFEDAIDMFTDCLNIEPAAAPAYRGRGVSHFKLEHWTESTADFKKAKELDPNDLESHVGFAMGLAMNNKIYEAIDVFENLLRVHPGYVRGHVQLGQLYYRMGLIPKGHAQMEQALASRPVLEERRMIEGLLKEQKVLDKKRYYRPDFEALRKNKQSALRDWVQKILRIFSRHE